MTDTAITESNWSSDDYVWHLLPPFSQSGQFFFDCRHWWEDRTAINHYSATFEVLRRHPLAKNIHLTEWPGASQSRHLSYFLWIHGLSPWSALSHEDQQCFQQVLYEEYSGKGNRINGLFDITALSESKHAKPAALICPETREMEVGRFASEHHRAGRLVVAVDMDFGSLDEALRLFKNCYRNYWKKPEKVQRSRIGNWLEIIRKFENSESQRDLEREIRDKELFRSYRNLFSDIWEQPLSPEST